MPGKRKPVSKQGLSVALDYALSKGQSGSLLLFRSGGTVGKKSLNNAGLRTLVLPRPGLGRVGDDTRWLGGLVEPIWSSLRAFDLGEEISLKNFESNWGRTLNVRLESFGQNSHRGEEADLGLGEFVRVQRDDGRVSIVWSTDKPLLEILGQLTSTSRLMKRQLASVGGSARDVNGDAWPVTTPTVRDMNASQAWGEIRDDATGSIMFATLPFDHFTFIYRREMRTGGDFAEAALVYPKPSAIDTDLVRKTGTPAVREHANEIVRNSSIANIN